jgi:hypothetical protein
MIDIAILAFNSTAEEIRGASSPFFWPAVSHFWGPPESVTDGLGMTKVFRTQTPLWMRYSVSSKTTIRGK